LRNTRLMATTVSDGRKAGNSSRNDGCDRSDYVVVQLLRLGTCVDSVADVDAAIDIPTYRDPTNSSGHAAVLGDGT
jgi:hypothetical protein